MPTVENLPGCVPSASTVDDPQSGEAEQREHIKNFLQVCPSLSTAATAGYAMESLHRGSS
jgi:hypothetical protein